MSVFQKELEKVIEYAFDEHLDNYAKIKVDISFYLFCLQSQFSDLHKNFYDIDDLILHRNLNIQDYDGNKVELEDLPPQRQEEISNYILLQKSALHCLSEKFNYLNRQIVNTHIKWLAPEMAIMELSIALFYGGFVGFEDRKISKTEFFDHMLTITGINLDSYNISQNKILSRENPTSFIDSLKEVIIKLIEKNLK